MLKSLISKFWGVEQDLSLEDVYSVLNTDDVDDHKNETCELQTQTQDIDVYGCCRKIGVVTRAENGKFTIDDVYEFKQKNLAVAVGAKVSFTAYNVGGKLQVSNVNVLDDEWNNDPEQKSNWCHRSFITKVTERARRVIYVNPGDLSIDLNAVRSEFVPIVGDWLDLDVKCEVDENVVNLTGRILEVNKISPLRPKITKGVVKLWNVTERTGVINQNVFFNRESLDVGYVPVVGDKVVTEIIESEQGRCSWRSLKVVLDGTTKFETGCFNTSKSNHVFEHGYVDISDDVFVDFAGTNERKDFEFKISNVSDVDLSLVNVEVSTNSQCKLIAELPLVIKSDESSIVRGFCVVKNVGESRELLIFVFDGFRIGRWVNIRFCQVTSGETYNRTNPSINHRIFTGKEVIRGPRPVSAPHFIPVHLPEYQVPQKLFDVVTKYANTDHNVLLEELRLTKPVLAKPVLAKELCFQYYEDRFHTLVHLEEIQALLSIRRYDQEKACFVKNGEFLMLEIENLSEQRPSIIPGDKVVAVDPFTSNKSAFEAFVYKVGAKHIYLKFAQIFHEQYDGEDYSIKIVQSRAAMRRQHQAVGLAVKNLGRDLLFPSRVVEKEPQVNISIKTDEDSQAKAKSSVKLSNSELLRILRARKSKEELIVDPNDVENRCFMLEWNNEDLNYYQKEAVRNIVVGECRPLPYLIFGPPGTGKTVTVVETVLQLLRLISHSRLLVAAPSNSAADLIATRLIDSGVLKPGDLVRLVANRYVSENRIPDKLVPYSATVSLAAEGTTIQNTVTESGLTLGCSSAVIGRHRITVSTCSNIGSLYAMGFPKGHFTHIIIDEAAQTSEPECMIPLSFLDTSSGQVVLAGDPMQLGAVALSKCAAEYGLKESYMERLMNRFPYVRDIDGFPDSGGYDPRLVTKLIYNYRSLPEILELPNSMFYHSELIPTISPQCSVEANLLNNIREILPSRNDGSPPAFVFHGVDGENYQTFDSPSWYNPYEASQIFYYVNELYRLGVSSSDIGIMSPYVKQVKQIRSVLLEAEYDVPKIGTVEEFQGQEFNVILLSTVRSNKNMIDEDCRHNLGFIFNPRRFNVALTRARVLLVIVGNPRLLATDVVWRNALAYAVKNGSYCGCDISSVL